MIDIILLNLSTATQPHGQGRIVGCLDFTVFTSLSLPLRYCQRRIIDRLLILEAQEIPFPGWQTEFTL
jgi:hypothetical protein